MFAQKFWLGLEWREEEEGLCPKAYKDKREDKTLGVPFLEIIEMIQDAPFLWT